MMAEFASVPGCGMALFTIIHAAAGGYFGTQEMAMSACRRCEEDPHRNRWQKPRRGARPMTWETLHGPHMRPHRAFVSMLVNIAQKEKTAPSPA
jgi:hypothetical protein